MAECFCGCERRVSFTDRNLNSQGRHTVDLIDRLETAQARFDGGLMAEGGENAGAISVLQKSLRQGQQFSDLFRHAVHREPLPSPREASALRREWGEWRKTAATLADLFSLPEDELVAALHSAATEEAAAASAPAAERPLAPGRIEVGPWFSEPEYKSVAYIDEAGDPPRSGLYVFVNTRMAEEEASAATDEFSAEIFREKITESDLDFVEKIEAAANLPADSDQVQAATYTPSTIQQTG